LISNVNSRTYANQSSIDQTLAGLGYETVVFEGRGESSESFQFYIPSGKTVAPEAYFEVALNNSTLLNYARSGVFVTLNDLPIGSVRLSDDTANQFSNRIRIPIPPSTVRSGLNNLDVTAILEPREECADPNQGGLFVSLWSDSRLYLPLAPTEVNPADVPDLTAYPRPFMQLPELGSTAFILQRDNFESWRHAIKLAGNLGATSDGAIFTPAAFYADEVPDSARSVYNMLLVGIPSQLKLLGEINDKLPGPFEGTGDIASEKELQVIYEIDPGQSAGYLELVTSPWNQENLIIAVVGNSSQGLKLAAEALLNQEQRPKLLGDFAVVTNEQVIAIDTRLFAAGNTLVTQPTAEPPVSTTKQDSPTASRFAIPGNWLLIAMGLTFLIIVVVVGIALYARKKGK
jgi:hypothetical protein